MILVLLKNTGMNVRWLSYGFRQLPTD